ncbi:hypothetical protein AB0L71_10270 [Streptomyces sp. NPDC052052]|uniref:hypothetical protein n=1 Tax=Streptomyces sp. NPDC052052 TaxID=3154756 RepID=UPI0034324F19
MLSFELVCRLFARGGGFGGVAGLKNLSEHGPTGPVFLRFGRDHMEPLWQAIGKLRRGAVDVRGGEEIAGVREECKV